MTTDPPLPHAPRWLTRLAWIQLAFVVLVAGVWTTCNLRAPMDPDFTAGELHDTVLAWQDTGTLYAPPTAPPYRVVVYPPLYLAGVRLVAALGLPPLLAGRLLALAAFALVLLLLQRWLTRSVHSGAHEAPVRPQEGLTPSLAAALAAAFLGSNFNALFYLGQLHLQWPAVALSLLGFYLARDPGRARVILAGVACALACFTKHTQVFSTVILGAWLLRYRWRDALIFGATVAMVGAAGALILDRAFGPEIWRQLLTYTVGTYSWTQLRRALFWHGLGWSPLIVVGLWLGARASARDERATLRWWFFAGTTATLITSARVGAAGAYFLEWSCAAVLWVGPLLVRAAAKARPRRWLLPVACVAQLLLADVFAVARLVDEGTSFQESLRALPTMCAAIRQLTNCASTAGRQLVVTEEAGFVRVCGVEPVHHSFIMANLAQRRLWDDRPFVAALRRRAYPAVVMPFDVRQPIDTERWTLPMLSAIRESYVTVAESERWRALAPGAVTTRQPQ